MRRSRTNRRGVKDADYHRPVRDEILATVKHENRQLTADERRRLFAESWNMAKAGWYILDVHDDDDRAIESAQETRRRRKHRREELDAYEEQRIKSVKRAYDKNAAEYDAGVRRRRKRERDELRRQVKGTLGELFL